MGEDIGLSSFLDNAAFEDGLNQYLDGLGQMTGLTDAASEMVTGALRRIGEIALEALGNAAQAAFQAMVTGALENEQALSRLQTVLNSTGNTSGFTVGELEALSNQFTDLAGGSNDAVLAIEEIAIRSGQVAREDFPAFIQTALDLGTVLGDTGSAAQLLVKIGDEPVSAINRLEKAGIAFTDQQEEQVKAMVKSGDVAGATALVMGRVAEATSGAAAAAAGTLSGQWAVFTGRMGEAAEAIGTAFLPVAHELFDNVIAPAIPLVEGLAAALANAITTGDFSALIPPDVAAQFGPIVDAFSGLGAAVQSSMPMIMAAVGNMVAFVQEQIAIFGPTIIANVAGTLNTLTAFWNAHGAEVMAVVTFAFNTVVTVVGGAITLLSGLISAGVTFVTGVWSAWSALLQGDTQGAFNAIVLAVSQAMLTVLSTIGSVLEGAAGLVGSSLAEIRSTWSNNFNMLVTIATTVFNNVVSAIEDAVSQAVSLGVQFVTGIADGVKSAAGQLVAAASQAVLDAIAGAQAALGISSPSTVARDQVGVPVGQGMVQGVLSQIGAMQSATRALASAAVGGVGGTTIYNQQTSSQQWNVNIPVQDTAQNVVGSLAVAQALWSA